MAKRPVHAARQKAMCQAKRDRAVGVAAHADVRAAVGAELDVVVAASNRSQARVLGTQRLTGDARQQRGHGCPALHGAPAALGGEAGVGFDMLIMKACDAYGSTKPGSPCLGASWPTSPNSSAKVRST